MSLSCEIQGCEEKANLRCSRCKLVYYCSKKHQKKDWNIHKNKCKHNTKDEFESISSDNIKEVRECRCMFCGQLSSYKSEEEAIEHMNNCSILLEQLNDRNNQFTLPKNLK